MYCFPLLIHEVVCNTTSVVAVLDGGMQERIKRITYIVVQGPDFSLSRNAIKIVVDWFIAGVNASRLSCGGEGGKKGDIIIYSLFNLKQNWSMALFVAIYTDAKIAKRSQFKINNRFCVSVCLSFQREPGGRTHLYIP